MRRETVVVLRPCRRYQWLGKERQDTQDEQRASECMPCFVYSLREEQRAYEQRKMREWKRDSGDLSWWVRECEIRHMA
jgi:hypothetical protein